MSDGASSFQVTAGVLSQPVPAIDGRTTNEGAMAFWLEHPDQESAAVVDQGRPIGLLNRHAFMESWARPFQRELFGRRGCDSWMDREPLIVEATLPLQALATRAIQAGSRVLANGFISVRDGRYEGIGTGLALLEATSAAEAERARQIRESIEYGSVIQRSGLEVSARELARAWPDHALIWEPRDLVGGDCYFFRARPGALVGAVLDCTGHGVPGAFMTVIALSILERAVDDSGAGLPDPGALLSALNVGIKRALGQRSDEGDQGLRSDDGLDGACFILSHAERRFSWAGARMPLLIGEDEDAKLFEASRVSVGYRETPDTQVWETRSLVLPERAVLALTTDGISDQIGGPRGIAFGRRRTLEVLGNACHKGARGAADALRDALRTWQGTEPRRDDVTALLLGTGART